MQEIDTFDLELKQRAQERKVRAEKRNAEAKTYIRKWQIAATIVVVLAIMVHVIGWFVL